MITGLFYILIGACIYMFNLWLGAAYGLFLLLQLYKLYKLKKSYKTMNELLSSMGYAEQSKGVYAARAALEDRDKGKGGGYDH